MPDLESPDWDKVVECHAERVFRIAYRILGSVHDAEDVSQTVFTEAVRIHALFPTHDPEWRSVSMPAANDYENPFSGPKSQLEAAVESVLSQPIDSDAVARVKARAAACLPSRFAATATLPSESSSAVTCNPERVVPFPDRSLLMKVVSTAAVLALAVGTVLLLQSSPSAFGQVLERLATARSLSYVSRIYIKEAAEPIESKVMVAADGRSRTESTGGLVTITDPASHRSLILIERSKRAITSEMAAGGRAGSGFDPADWLEGLKAHGDKPVEKLRSRVMDGRSLDGFITRQGKFDYRIWVDAETNELVEVEYGSFVKGSDITKVVMTDFRFDESMDPTLFSLKIPEGYTAQNQVVPRVSGGEQSVIEALRGFTKRSSGKFPESISDWGAWAVLFSTGSDDGVPSADTTEVMAHLGSITPFLVQLPKDDYEYLGEGKSIADKRSIVFWYRKPDGTIRAIYNDLSVNEIDQSDLP